MHFQISEDKLSKQFQELVSKKQISKQNKQKEAKQLLMNHKKNKNIISQFYKKQQKLLCVNSQKNLKFQVQKFFLNRQIKSRTLKHNKNICFVSTITNNANFINLDDNSWSTLNMAYIYENEIKEEKNLYSDLIKSFLISGRPIPADISVRLLLRAISIESRQNILVKGFPNSIDHFLTWDQQVGQEMKIPKIILFQINKEQMKQHFLQKKIQFNQQLVQYLIKNEQQLHDMICKSDWKWTKFVRTSPNLKQQVLKFIN